MGGFLGFVALHARDIGMRDSGPVLLLFGLVVVVCRIVFARLPDRVQPFRLAVLALGMAAVGLGVVAVYPSPIGLLVGAAILAAGVAFITPAVFAAILGRVPAAERGSAMATASVFIDLAFGGGPILVGVVAGFLSIPAGFAAAAAVAAAGAIGSALALRPRRQAAPA
jgi:MFS family permease